MFCSPKGEDVFQRDKTSCFTLKALQRLASSWNSTNPTNKIHNVGRLQKRKLWQQLSDKMMTLCNGSDKEACWVDHLEGKRPSKEVAQSLRPLKPIEWQSNEYTWLTNYDIEAVMEQYDFDVNKSYKYKFLGVYPIDFQAKTVFGQCLFTEFCSLRISDFHKKGINFLGMITNLDKHDQSGSHWTSLFMCINPHLPCFGAYYYDSVGSKPPSEIMAFIASVKEQLRTIPGAENKVFKVRYNKNRHQKGNSECGVFSMDYQVRWIEALVRNHATVFEDIVDIKINDDMIHKLRNVYFRPSSRLKR
jgi:hypothetical protein